MDAVSACSLLFTRVTFRTIPSVTADRTGTEIRSAPARPIPASSSSSATVRTVVLETAERPSATRVTDLGVEMDSGLRRPDSSAPGEAETAE